MGQPELRRPERDHLIQCTGGQLGLGRLWGKGGLVWNADSPMLLPSPATCSSGQHALHLEKIMQKGKCSIIMQPYDAQEN